MSLLDSVLSKLRSGESEDQVLAFLDTLSWNEIRAIKAKLVLDTNTQSTDGGRTKPELHKTIVKLGQLYLASSGSAAASVQKKQKLAAEEKPASPPRSAAAPVAAVNGTPSVPAAAASAPANGAAIAGTVPGAAGAPGAAAAVEGSLFVKPDHPYDAETLRPLAPNDKPVPTLQSMGFPRSSFAYGVASNDFTCSVYDSCYVTENGGKRKQGVSEAELATVGTALLLNTRLRKIVLPFSGLTDKDLGVLFGPCIEHGHRLGVTVLDLRHNALTKNCVTVLVAAIGLCPNLQRLLLDENELREAGLLPIFKVLPPTLRTLSFTRCNDKIAAALAGELKSWPGLTQLCVREGTLTDAGLSKLCAALVAQGPSSQVCRLDLRKNTLSAKSLPLLADAMRQLGSLWWIQDDDNPMGATRPTLLRDTAREKFRCFMPTSHPAVELQTLLINEHQFASVSPQRSLELACACLAVGLDVSAAPAVGTLSPLHCAAAYFGDGQMLELLLAAPGAREAVGDLLAVVPSTSPENLRLLLESGMRPKATLTGGIPYIVGLATYAWTKGQAKDVRGWLYRLKLLLLLDGSCVNECDADGETALSVLARSSYSEVVDLLLQCGADARCRDKSFQNTPMHWACKYGNANTVRTLLKCSDLTCKNAAGETPLDTAKKNARAQVELELAAYLRGQRK